MRKTEGKRRISNCAERYLKNECLQIFADMADMFRWIIHFWGSRPIPGAWTATRRFITASSVAIRSWTKRMMWMDPRKRSISIVFQQAMVEIQNFSKYAQQKDWNLRCMVYLQLLQLCSDNFRFVQIILSWSWWQGSHDRYNGLYHARDLSISWLWGGHKPGVTFLALFLLHPFFIFFPLTFFSLKRSPLNARPFNMALVLLSPFPLKDGCNWWHWNPAPTKTRMPRDRDDEDMFFTSFMWILRKHVGNSGTVI